MKRLIAVLDRRPALTACGTRKVRDARTGARRRAAVADHRGAGAPPASRAAAPPTGRYRRRPAAASRRRIDRPAPSPCSCGSPATARSSRPGAPARTPLRPRGWR